MSAFFLKRRFDDDSPRPRKIFHKWKRKENQKSVYYKNNKVNTENSFIPPILLDNTNAESNSFDSKLIDIVGQIEMPPLVVETKINFIIKSLQAEFKLAKIQYIRIEPFGSSVTGLSLKDSDVDIFIRFKSPSLEIMKKIKSQLVCSKNFRSIILISTARVPIIKCDHIPSHTKCDLSAFSHLGCENTILIKQYFNFDHNLRPMILFLKYWLKIHNIHGMGKINTYALIWLVIFYLQSPNEKRLPTVHQLQQLSDKTVMVKSWDCRFSFNALSMPCINSIGGIHSLLLGFFKFYVTFDFKNYVMSPYIGDKISILDFEGVNHLPECFSIYKNLVNSSVVKEFGTNHHIFLQDPFEHNLNIIKQAGSNIIHKFRQLCGAGAKIFQEQSSSTAINNLLNYKLVVNPSNMNKQLTVALKWRHFPQIFNGKDCFKKTFEALRYVLEKVFLFQLTIFNQDREMKELNTIATFDAGISKASNADSNSIQNIIINVESPELTGKKHNLNYSSKIIINCSTFLNVIEKRNTCKIKRKKLDSIYDIDLEIKKSQICAVTIDNEIKIQIEFVPRGDKQILLYMDAPPFFSQFFKQSCIDLMRQAITKLYINPPIVEKEPEVFVISSDDEEEEKKEEMKEN